MPTVGARPLEPTNKREDHRRKGAVMQAPVVLATSPFLRADPSAQHLGADHHDHHLPVLQASIVRDGAAGPPAEEPAETLSPVLARSTSQPRAAAVREKERLTDCEPFRPPKLYRVSVQAFPRRGGSTQFQVRLLPLSSVGDGVGKWSQEVDAQELKLSKTYADCEELARGLSMKHIRFATKHMPYNVFSASQKELAVEKNRRAIQYFLEHVLHDHLFSRDDAVQDFFFPHRLQTSCSLQEHDRNLATMLRVRAPLKPAFLCLVEWLCISPLSMLHHNGVGTDCDAGGGALTRHHAGSSSTNQARARGGQA